jgi:hypothetical protein
VTRDDWTLLSTRVQAKVEGHEDLSRFDDAMRIYAYKDDIKAYNHFRMRELNRLVLLVEASHTSGVPAERASTDEAGNLHKEMLLSINTRIMLRENLWVERRLFNGLMGTVRDIIWEAGADFTKDPPFAILVDFDEYDAEGPCVVLDLATNRLLVPIFRVKRDWVKATVACTRTQFPVTNAYAITVHKSQGLSVDMAVLNPGKKRDFIPGLTYVAISRVRSLRGILFKEPFDFKRLKFSTTDTTIMRAADLARRQQQEIPLPDVVMEDDNDLPLTFPTSIGQASQMEVPILPLDPVALSGELRSTVTIPSGLFSDVDSRPAAPPAPVIQYVAGLIPLNPGQYSVMASQGHTQDAFFECLEPAPFCNHDPVPSCYRVLPSVNICI